MDNRNSSIHGGGHSAAASGTRKEAKQPWVTPSLVELEPGSERYEQAKRALAAARKAQ